MMPRNPKNAAFLIFHRLFDVEIPEIFFHEQDADGVISRHYSGDDEEDSVYLRSSRHVKLPISDMAERIDLGVPITLVYPKDSVSIYQLIQKHLQDWQWILSNSLNGKAPPRDDLMKLDQLAQIVHGISLRFNDGETPTGGFAAMAKRMSNNTPLAKPVMSIAKKRRRNAYLDDDEQPVTQRPQREYQSVLPSIIRQHR